MTAYRSSEKDLATCISLDLEKENQRLRSEVADLNRRLGALSVGIHPYNSKYHLLDKFSQAVCPCCSDTRSRTWLKCKLVNVKKLKHWYAPWLGYDSMEYFEISCSSCGSVYRMHLPNDTEHGQ